MPHLPHLCSNSFAVTGDPTVSPSYGDGKNCAQRFHEVGLDDEAYADVLNTVAIQTSFDRLANSLGVRPDS